MAEKIADLAHSMGTVVQVDRDMVHIAEAQAGFAQAIGDRLRGKPRPMLDAPKTLFFCGCHQLAVHHQGSRRIAVEGIDAEDNHGGISNYDLVETT